MESFGQFEHCVRDAAGLHVRPAANLSRFVSGLTSNVLVEANGKKANGKSALGLMSLGVSCGSSVLITLEGDNAAAEVDQVRLFCEENV